MSHNTLTPSPPRRLVRSVDDKMLAGVCSGIAAYLHIDPTVVRVVYALLTFFTGVVPGVVVYLALMLVMPRASAASNWRTT